MEGAEFCPRHHSKDASEFVGIGQGRVMMIAGSSADLAYYATQQ